MVKQTLSLRSSGDLDVLLSRGGGRHWQVLVDIPELDEGERLRWGRLITRYYRACGCDTGAAATVLSLAGYAIYLIVDPELLVGSPLKAVLLGLGLLLAAAIAGKAVGLLHAQVRLRQAVESLRSRLTQPPPGKE